MWLGIIVNLYVAGYHNHLIQLRFNPNIACTYFILIYNACLKQNTCDLVYSRFQSHKEIDKQLNERLIELSMSPLNNV